jgi:hypothetical protein
LAVAKQLAIAKLFPAMLVPYGFDAKFGIFGHCVQVPGEPVETAP